MPKLYRRNFLVSAGTFGVAASLGLVRPAGAQQWPTQNLLFVCGYPAGSGADLIVRFFAEKVRRLSGKIVVIENRVGAGGDLATEYVARSRPDGHTILVTGAGGIAGIMSLRKNPPIDVAKTMQVVAALHRQSFMVVVDANTPYRTLDDLTKAMLLKGDKANFGTNELNGTVIGTIYKNTTGVKAQEVSYRTANDTINDMSSGALDFAIHNPLFALVQQRNGRMRILGIAANERMASQPDLPTMTEQGVPMDIQGWWCVSVPAGTPQVAIDQLNKWFVEIVGSDESKKFLNDAGGDPFILSPAQAQELFLKEIEKWRERVTLAKITPQ